MTFMIGHRYIKKDTDIFLPCVKTMTWLDIIGVKV
jgi:hypothetical protein